MSFPSPIRSVLVFALASLPLAVPGTFWLVTSRAGWPRVLSPRFLPDRRPRAFAGILLFACCTLVGLLMAFYAPEFGSGECRVYPTLSVQRFPDHAVFTASLAFAGGTYLDPRFGTWSVMRVQQKFWGIPWWAHNIVIVRGFRVEKGEYLVDARRSQGLLTHFLPMVDRLTFIHAATRGPIGRAVAGLRALQDGPPKSGVRIIGTVCRDMYVTSEPAPQRGSDCYGSEREHLNYGRPTGRLRSRWLARGKLFCDG
jgi:hypothetical protein